MASPKSAWGSVAQQAHSLTDVMTEQLLEDEHLIELPAEHFPSPQPATSSNTEDLIRNVLADDNLKTDNDYLIALMLQEQFNMEHDEELLRYESAINGNSKVAISYEKHRLISAAQLNQLKEEDDLAMEDEEGDNAPEFMVDDLGNQTKVDCHGNPILHFNKHGYCGKGRLMKTKHDASLSERRNVSKVVNSFSPAFATGDLDGLSTKRLTNRVYNQLKQAAHVDDKRRHRTKEPIGEDFSTVEHAVDGRTRRILFRLLQQDRLSHISGVVSTGKESIVLYAEGGSGQTITGKHFPAHCALKVFKTTLTGFKHRRMYVESDYRFRRNDLKKRQNPRKVIRLWAAKEALNLSRLRKCGLPCPEPILLRHHVLVMQFVGSPGADNAPNPAIQILPNVETILPVSAANSAPTLHHCATVPKCLTSEQWRSAYKQCKQHVHDMYHSCQLVHGDLSEYNLLWHENVVWIIDVSQAVDVNHKYAWDFLRRDCANIMKFFQKVLPAEEVSPYEVFFNEVTGVNIGGRGQDFLNNFRLFVSTMRTQPILKKDRDNVIASMEYQMEDMDSFDVVALLAMRESCLQVDGLFDKEEDDDDDDDNDEDEDDDDSEDEDEVVKDN